MFRNLFCSILILAVFQSTLSANDVEKVTVTNPSPYEVVQREFVETDSSYDRSSYGQPPGFADVELEWTAPEGIRGQWQCRTIPLAEGATTTENWLNLELKAEGNTLRALAEINAGGWYRMEIRCVQGEGHILAAGSVEPFGVGEVFLVAGQSYAAGANDELLNVSDPQGRVSAFDWETNQWRLANDPQPHVGEGGTIWPALGDVLVPTLRVPVGFVNVAVGGTSSTKWLPRGDLHQRLVKVGRRVGSFRAVLWQQGESDVIEETSTETYVNNLIKIRESAARAWQFEPTWLLAKSTLHPTVYQNPEGEERIRLAVSQLWKRPHFAPGPDTDVLSGENRGGPNSRRHFSAIGQRRAALLWFVAIWNEIEKQSK